MSYEPGSGMDPGSSGGSSTGVQDRMKEKTLGAAEQLQEKTQDVKVQARTQLDQRTTDAGEQMRSVADALRQSGGSLQEQGKDQPAKIVQQVADRVERFGGYLTETDGDRLMRDVEDFGRRRPWALAGIGALVGLAASRFLKASGASRQQEYGSGFDGSSSTAAPRPGYVPTSPEPALPSTTGMPVGAPAGGSMTTPPPRDPASPSGI